MKVTKGTKEWADSNVNLYSGCSNDCRYCYARKMAIRFNRKTDADWRVMELNEKAWKKGYKKRKGRIMFPTSHDITPGSWIKCFDVLEKLVKAGNNVLVTTKPVPEIIKALCNHFARWKWNIQFRFTITSMDTAKLAYWEPGAPSFLERLSALKLARACGYKTSLSIEPCLDADPRKMIELLKPYVTGTIWLGPMNYNGNHEFNSLETLADWVAWFEDDPVVKLKDTVYNRLQLVNPRGEPPNSA